MKSLKNKFNISILISTLMFAFVFALCFLNFAPLHVALAETQNKLININFVNRNDKIMLNDAEFDGDIYYDQTQNEIVDESNQPINLRIVSDEQRFAGWSIANSNALGGFETLGGEFDFSFSLKTLLNKIYNIDESAYLSNVDGVGENTITLNSHRSETRLIVDDESLSHGKVLISGVNFSGEMPVNYNTKYSLSVVPDNNYYVSSVKIYKNDDYQNSREPLTTLHSGDPFVFQTADANSYTIVVEYQKIEYKVQFIAKNAHFGSTDIFFASSQLSTKQTEVCVDESMKQNLVVTSSNFWRFNSFKIFNNQTEQYEDFELIDDQVYDSEFFAKYANHDVVQVYVLFDKLYKVEVGSTGEGSFLAYLNSNLVPENEFVNSKAILYVSEEENVRIVAVPKQNNVLLAFENATKDEVVRNSCNLENISQDRTINVQFEPSYYAVKFVATDTNGEHLPEFDGFASLYVNGSQSAKLRDSDKITAVRGDFSGLGANHKFVKFQIYNLTHGWEDLVVTQGMPIVVDNEFKSMYMVGEDKSVYVRAVYKRVFNVLIVIDDSSLGAGYFDVDVLDSNDQIVKSVSKVTGYYDEAEVGSKIRVTAKAYRGYDFVDFTIPNPNPADNHIIKKVVNYEDVSFKLIYKKISVDVNVQSEASNAFIKNLASEEVNVGDKITLAYKLDFARDLGNVYINGQNVSKMDYVDVTDNAIIINVTTDFLGSLDSEGNISVKITTVHDASFISLVIVIPILLAVLVAGLVVILVYYFKKHNKHKELKNSELLKNK